MARCSAASARRGMILNAKALLDRNPDPSEEEVREALAGNFCRCTGYQKPVEAVLAAASEQHRAGAEAGRRGGAMSGHAGGRPESSARWTASSWSPAARHSPTISTFRAC